MRDAEVIADLAADEGRTAMGEQVGQLAGDGLDVVIANAGVTHPDALCYQVNYHGAVSSPAGGSHRFRADPVKVEALESGQDPDQDSDFGGGYSISKYAIAHRVRVNASRPEWAGGGILLNVVCSRWKSTLKLRSRVSATNGPQEGAFGCSLGLGAPSTITCPRRH